MSAVNLSRELVLEGAVQLPDGAGGFRENWQALGTLWAEIKAGSGRETSGGFGPVSRMSYRITVRGAPFGTASRPKADQRFRDGGRVFRILAVGESDANGRYLICHAIEEVAA
ncbi:head-tail adaptor protein [Parasulfitobacter algicola]|uniref:Head-tail adaptor protein n=1 Tax=Parasulfitobacter algicola TaxID=2614809 RepID=A0ABX2IVC2_9RHOB|nr:head-tail adaptor protein [Sulfitobacter algicola]NSX56255.1 head-tail adaptor protein [Sulfitobacter algicola]